MRIVFFIEVGYLKTCERFIISLQKIMAKDFKRGKCFKLIGALITC